MVSLKNTIYLFLFGDIMKAKELFEKHQKELDRMVAEEKSLGNMEISYRIILKNAEKKKMKNDNIISKFLTLVKRDSAQKTVAEQHHIITEMRKGLQQIEKRKNELARTREKKEIENAQMEANVRKVMTNMERERTEVQREQQREWEMQEKMDRVGTDFGATRLMKRRRK